MTGQSIVDDARAHLKVWRSLPFPPEIVASKMWDDNTADISTVLEANTAEEVVAGISSKGPISAAIRTDSPNWQQRCDDTLRGWPEKS